MAGEIDKLFGVMLLVTQFEFGSHMLRQGGDHQNS